MTTHRLTFYRPREGADLVIKIEDGDVNVSQCIAMQLHKIWSQEQQRLNKGRQAFISNITYRFSSGLVFRLFDSGLQDGNEAIEFLFAVSRPLERRLALDSIIDLLANCGIERSDLIDLRLTLQGINSESSALQEMVIPKSEAEPVVLQQYDLTEEEMRQLRKESTEGIKLFRSILERKRASVEAPAIEGQSPDSEQ